MIAADAGSLSLGGELTVVNYVERLEEAKAALREGRLAIDFANVREIDSSAIAFMLECVRASGNKVVFKSLPNTLSGLVSLYGVTDLLKIS
ncbi:MAG: STAS domain-containing protein [Proteobacteria bacterium]|nr:STAS domain-containing protein [Pseudomonadota bacterium]MDA1012169.1 STAS domain-containing protein [Pseudomonadota bacterium]